MSRDHEAAQAVSDGVKSVESIKISQQRAKEMFECIDKLELELEERWDEWMKKARRIKGLTELSREIMEDLGVGIPRNERQWKLFKIAIIEECNKESEVAKEVIKKEVEESKYGLMMEMLRVMQIQIDKQKEEREQIAREREEKEKKKKEEKNKIERDRRIKELEEKERERIEDEERKKEIWEIGEALLAEKRRRMRCYTCNRPGHISRYCWRRNESDRNN